MKRTATLFLLSLVFPLLLVAQQSGAEKISATLLQRIQQNPNENQDIRILLSDRIDVQALDADFYKQNTSLADRGRRLIHQLKTKAAATQGPLLHFLSAEPAVEQASIEPYWIANLIVARTLPAIVWQLAARQDVAALYWDAPIEADEFEEVGAAPLTVNGHEPGHDAINAPAMWALGYTGYGRTALIIDSGVDGEHPALKSRYRGNYVPAAQAWFDQRGTTDPFNCGSHGSHVTGTIVGLNAANKDTIGVAFNGLWMGSAGLCSGTSTIAALQWALDPDGDSTTVADMPDVINNSWNSGAGGTSECQSDFADVFDALEAAGIAVVFSAGNSGPDIQTITAPKNINSSLVNVFTVASVNGNVSSYPISSFSSRGPSTCGGDSSLLIKPEVSAPGQNVRSSVLNEGYAFFSGTSMSAPHASGAILLLKEAFPYLTGTEIKLALYFSAADLGDPGEDNVYGMGLIDVVAAYDYLIAQGNVPDTLAASAAYYDVAIEAITGISNLQCVAQTTPEIGLVNRGDSTLNSVRIFYNYSGLVVDSMIWTGTLAPGGQQLVALPAETLPTGAYRLTVQVAQPNGLEDLRYLDNVASRDFFVVENVSPTTNSASICAGASALLSASAPTMTPVQWYTTPTGGTPVASGSTFLTPPLTTSRTYYATVSQTATAGLPESSPRERTSDVSKSLVFDSFNPFRLVSVKVHSQIEAPRVIQLLNSNGDPLYYQSHTLDTGLQEVFLNITVPAGTNYRLGVDGFSKFALTDTLLSYPYVLPGVLSIKNSSEGQGVYYYFYDWKVEFGAVCGRTPATVTVSPGSVSPAFTASTQAIDLAASGTVQFTDNTPGATAWAWDFGDGASSSLQNPLHTYTDSGAYLVTLTVTGPDGCAGSATMEITATGIVGLESGLAALGKVSVFPNPSTGVFTLSLDLERSFPVRFLVYDALGRRIVSQPDLTIRRDEIRLDLAAQPDGMYYLLLEIGSRSAVLKLLKDR